MRDQTEPAFLGSNIPNCNTSCYNNVRAICLTLIFFGSIRAEALQLCELSGSMDEVRSNISSSTGIPMPRDNEHCSIANQIECCRWSVGDNKIEVSENATTHIIVIRTTGKLTTGAGGYQDNRAFAAALTAIKELGASVDNQVTESISLAIDSEKDTFISNDGLCALYYISKMPERVLNFIAPYNQK
jgi:hypothetical protein